ncbi:hypothetical protein [Agromyces marinus]|uniref:Transcriptional regulator, AbiEi antitoxin, Type IV TA system n=1 Tax=Agromyces marinus TaxID=1389020 RepID=A0ABM8H1X7_9MICO|nr:hypothetical protein [Agromyces marinus]UIP60091.1 hypothetical protein DSM26151_30060 [Agromyces marinus]BDZ54789.1 hypothetical protein GCM10025870_18620 [Agromyces marinus]
MDEYTPKLVAIATARDLRDAGVAAPEREAGLVRVRRGLYVADAAWPATEREARHLIRMQAVMEAVTEPVFSHVSAAVLWGLPVVGALEGVHVMGNGKVGRRTRRGIVWHNHALGSGDVVELNGFQVTSLERTAFDIACSRGMEAGVAAVDAALRDRFVTGLGTSVSGVQRDALLDMFEARRGARGIRTALSCARFGDGRSGSAGESISRWNLHRLGFPPPELQVAFARDGGGFDIVDFDWPEHGRFGEFDGFGKYVRAPLTGGRSIEEVVWDEKRREDRVRRHRPFASRWGWSEARDLRALERRLLADGLPKCR